MIKLIAFLDGSKYSKSVCEYAAWIAAKMAGSVDLIHVLGRRDESDAPVDLSGSIGLGARTALLEELAELDGQMARLTHKRGRAILEDARDILQKSGIDQVNMMLRNDGIVETVQEFEKHADLIVIGKRGETTESDEMHIGSNFERVVRASHKPIMVASMNFRPVRRALIAFDGGPSAMKAVNYLAQNQAFNDIECHLLSVAEPSSKAKKQLESTADVLRDAGYTVETSIKAGQPEKVICETIKTSDSDLLLMGAYGHSRIRNLIIGSTTTAMIRSCKIPVLLFR
ncbi:MAG: universal stress protein [Gammaproteobacteria bacterium]|nr:MAG: universal stress protein [Gammaproteobacteria bacterium]